MNYRMIFTVTAFFCASLLTYAETTALKFETAPTIKCAEEKRADEARHAFQTMNFPLPESNGQSFSLEFKLNIQKFAHYGRLCVGLTNAKGQQIELSFLQQDDRIRRCTPLVQIAQGLDVKIKPFEPIEPGKMVVAFDYVATARTLTITLSKEDGTKLFTSGAVKVAGKINVNNFKIGVQDNGDGVSEISYNADGQCMFWRSYVGAEGGYAYAIEGTIDDIVYVIGN